MTDEAMIEAMARALDMRWVAQKEESGCVAATLAMMLGLSYEEAAALLRRQGDCYSAIALQEILYDRGWAKCIIGRKFLSTGELRAEYPPAPFAPIHRVSVKVNQGSKVYHSILWLASGAILDPMTPDARGFGDYGHIGGIEGWVPPATALQPFLTELKQEIRREAFEEAAKVAEAAADNDDRGSAPYDNGAGGMGYRRACYDIAASIQALPEHPVPTEETK